MAELLVRVVDKVNPSDPAKNAQLTKRGDVIVIADDGHPWSPAERAGDPWVIVQVPGAAVADLSAYIAPEPDDGTHKLLQRRAFSFNLTAYLANARPLTLPQALALKVLKPPIPDPSVL